MRRRDFIGLASSVALWGPLARAQQKVPIVGFLNPTSPEVWRVPLEAFHEGLRRAGYVDGQNVKIEYRWARGDYDRLPELAAELVGRNVTVLYAAGGDASSLAAKAATNTIPIVVSASSDPVALGLVSSLSHPGGNITGVARLNIELVPKRIELLREALPKVSAIAVLENPNNPNAVNVSKTVEQTAKDSGLHFEIFKAASIGEIDARFADIRVAGAHALVISPDVFFNGRAEQLGSLARAHRLPAIYQLREFVAAGGLMSLGANLVDAIRTTGVYVGKILDGAKPADLPVEQQSRLEFLFNLKVSKEFRLDIPTSILLRADEVIE
jgi:putative ABC transport system substrate-binding protein